MDLDIDPDHELRKFARLMDQASPKMRRQITRRMRMIVEPLRAVVASSTEEFLPERGGLAERASKAKMRGRVRRGRNAGVSFTAPPDPSGFKDPARVDRGKIKHPVFGLPHSVTPWVLQEVKPGWFSTPLEKAAPAVKQQLLEAISDAIAEVERGI